MLRCVLAWLGAGVALAVLTLACGPSAASPPAAPTSDAFAVVRATSQAAYLAGQTAIAQGDYLQACVDLDRAKTTDPDNRPEVQQALEQALTRCLTPPPAATSAPAAAQQRTLVVATISAGVGGALGGTPVVQAPPLAMPTPAPSSAPSSATPGSPTVNVATAALANTVGSTPAAGTQVPGGSPDVALATWDDPQGRFSIAAPSTWATTTQPQTLVGTGVVQFRDPGGLAEADVSVDTTARAVSPELYAASLELAMQQQVAGYAGEQVIPGTTSGSPSIERVFTFTQKDSSGQDHQQRGVQLVVVKGSTPYIVTASAPAEQFQKFSPTFDRVLASFKFS